MMPSLKMLCRIGIYISVLCEECGFACFATSSCLRCGHSVEADLHTGYSILEIVEEWKKRHPEE